MLTRDEDELAAVIIAMPYGQLLSVANQLASMLKSAREDGIPYKPESEDGMAKLLWYWADNKIDENKEG